jgi:uncharacterized damage-inducible protein DinB
MQPPSIPKASSEKEMLDAFLDYYRALMLDKAGGLTQEQLATRVAPSTMTLAGMIHHLAAVEDGWFHEVFLGGERFEPWASVDWAADPDWDWRVAAELDPAVIFDRYREAIARSQRTTDEAESLDQLSVQHRDGEHWSLRWILVHMIEETARHAGHADLIRESIDGATGDFREVE